MKLLAVILITLLNGIISLKYSRHTTTTIRTASLRTTLYAKTKPYIENISSNTINNDDTVRIDDSSSSSSSSSSGSISISSTSSSGSSSNASIQDYIILCIVPLIWGTYSPLIKYLYSSANILAPPPLLFNLLSYIVSFSTLSLASYSIKPTTASSSSSTTTTSSSLSFNNKILPFSTITPLEWQAGIQLGMLLFAGATIQIMGIQGTLATRAAILVQLTTVIVPFIESVINKKQISVNLWISSFIALVGVVFVSADEFIGNMLLNPTIDFNTISNTFSFNSGDLLVCISALFYSCHVVRVSQISKQVSAINLARVKSLTELIASSIAVFISIYFSTASTTSSSNEVFTYLSTAVSDPVQYGQVFVLFTVLWNGIFATALTTWAQTTGQRSIDSITAQLFYSSQPIWAASLSFLLLGDRISNVSFFGCILLLGAILYSQIIPNNDNNNDN